MTRMIYGLETDKEGRCIHYHGPMDIIANRCAKCMKFYACYRCHDELEDHSFEPVDSEEENTVMCGSCGRLYSYIEYASIAKCNDCSHDFNPRCSLHKTIYVRLIPFAQNGGGDLFCFLYEENEEEPRIVLYYHDDYRGPVLEASSFDEFIYVILLESASWSGDIENDHWKFHYQLLNDEYKEKLDGRTAEELAEEYESSNLENVDIWKS